MYELSVLLIYNKSALLKAIEGILLPFGAKIYYFDNFSESLAFIKNKKHKIDMILTGHILQDGDSFGFMKELENTRNDIPVYLITSNEEKSFAEKAINLGFTDLIITNSIREKLTKMILSHIEQTELKNLKGNALYLEDSKTAQKFLQEALKDTSLTINIFDNYKDAVNFMEKESVDVILVDFFLKDDYSGLDFVNEVRKNLNLLEPHIIILTAYDDLNRKVEFFRAGANDYIIKPFIKEELIYKIKYALEKKYISEECSIKCKEYDKKVMKDPLTGLYNRVILEEIIEKEIAIAKEKNQEIGFIFIDIDNFKKINDTYGHLFGDKVLVKVSEIIKSSIRAYDYAIRYGGEEILVILINSDPNIICKRAEDIRLKVEALDLEKTKITVSIGISMLSKAKDKTLFELIQLADEAMYESKKSGKNKVTCA